jgi:hypothetical protein
VRRAPSIRRLPSVAAGFAFACAHAWADGPRSCTDAASGPCNALQGYLHLLYVIAALLGVILVGVIAAALYYYHKVKNTELKP